MLTVWTARMESRSFSIALPAHDRHYVSLELEGRHQLTVPIHSRHVDRLIDRFAECEDYAMSLWYKDCNVEALMG